MRPYVDRFIELGWARAVDGDRITLTDEGEQAHQRVAERTGAERVRMMECLSSEELSTLMALLQRVATHLDHLAPEGSEAGGDLLGSC